MQDKARIVIIGGGAIGCSIAYHLAKSGERDVVVLEKAALCHGSTWHAAGLVGQLRSKRNLTRMLQYSAALYGKLEAETGQATDWKPVGSLRIAASEARWSEIRRTATTARSFGFELHLLSAGEARNLFPLMTTENVVGAAFIPTDGYVDPSSLTQALAKGARNGGVKFHEGVLVTEITVKDGRATSVVTDHGSVECEIVVNAAGIWARQVGAMAGVRVPAAAVEHQYMVTEKIPGLDPKLPSFRDPDSNFYLKPDVGGLAIGGWEDNTVPFHPGGIPFAFGRQLLPSNFERFEPIAESAARRLPVLEKTGIRTLINGPIPISPDGEPIMGKAPELDNFFVACGFTAGIAGSGGAGRAMAEWILHGDPGLDLWAFDIRRFGQHHLGRRYLSERSVESYGRYYAVHYPIEEAKSGRGGRRSPLYPILAARGAVFGSRFGWERPNWFAPPGVAAADEPAFETRGSWFPHVGAESTATRERVALFDQSSFSKFEIAGPGAFKALQYLAANNLDKAPGSATYTQMCNERGGIEADLTIMRLAEDRFYLVTGSGFGIRDSHWIRSHLPRDGSVTMSDVTSSRAVINVCGPLSHAVLQKIIDDPLDNASFPFLHAGELRVGYAPVLAVRITYVGELGWELHMPAEYAAHVYETLWQAGQEFGIADAGYRAIDSMRLEKRYLYWGADISPDYNPYEAGLGFCVALSKGSFLGAEALARIKAEGPRRKLCVFTTDGVAFGYVPTEEAGPDDYEIEAFCERHPAKRAAQALYDPERKKILA